MRRNSICFFLKFPNIARKTFVAEFDLGITKDRGYWHFVKWIPRRFAHVDNRAQVRRVLWTDSERDTRAKAPAVEAEFMAYWEALAACRKHDAEAAYETAKRLAIARGFSYRPAVELADASLEELVARLETLTGKEIALLERRHRLGTYAPDSSRE